MKKTMKIIRELSFRKLAVVIVSTDLVLACMVAILIANGDWFARANPSEPNCVTGQKTMKVVSKAKISTPICESRTNVRTTGTDAEAQETPASNEASSVLRPARAPGAPRVDFDAQTIIIVAAIFSFALVTPTALVVCFFVMLRRHIERLGALIQINAVAPAQTSARIHEAKPAVSHDSVVAAHFPPEEMPKQRGGALFERLFEETLELQAQLDGT